MPAGVYFMARGSHHSSGSHHGSHHSSSHSSHHGSSSHYRSSGSSSHRRSGYNTYGSWTSGGSHKGSPDIRSESPLRMPPSGVESYHGTWMFGKDYFINTQDEYYKNNFEEDKIPWPVRCYKGYLILLGIVLMGVFGNFFYEMIIPFWESISMTDGAFYLIDQIVYFGQWIIPVLLIAWQGWAVKRADQMERAFCLEMIQYYQAMKQRDEYEFKKKEHQASLRYYKECPNCGAPARENDTVCQYCDSSLLIPEARTWVVPEEKIEDPVSWQEQENLSQIPEDWT